MWWHGWQIQMLFITSIESNVMDKSGCDRTACVISLIGGSGLRNFIEVEVSRYTAGLWAHIFSILIFTLLPDAHLPHHLMKIEKREDGLRICNLGAEFSSYFSSVEASAAAVVMHNQTRLLILSSASLISIHGPGSLGRRFLMSSFRHMQPLTASSTLEFAAHTQSS